jgi:hypothetical protein
LVTVTRTVIRCGAVRGPFVAAADLLAAGMLQTFAASRVTVPDDIGR